MQARPKAQPIMRTAIFASVLLVAVMITSNWFGGGWISPRGPYVVVYRGTLSYGTMSSAPTDSASRGWVRLRYDSPYQFKLDFGTNTYGFWINFPLWILLLGAMGTAVQAGRLDARAKRRRRWQAERESAKGEITSGAPASIDITASTSQAQSLP
jgi:hypothetical protein